VRLPRVHPEVFFVFECHSPLTTHKHKDGFRSHRALIPSPSPKREKGEKHNSYENGSVSRAKSLTRSLPLPVLTSHHAQVQIILNRNGASASTCAIATAK